MPTVIPRSKNQETARKVGKRLTSWMPNSLKALGGLLSGGELDDPATWNPMMAGVKIPNKTLYHGTGRAIEGLLYADSSDPLAWFRKMVHFAEDPDLARYYAGNRLGNPSIIPAKAVSKGEGELLDFTSKIPRDDIERLRAANRAINGSKVSDTLLNDIDHPDPITRTSLFNNFVDSLDPELIKRAGFVGVKYPHPVQGYPGQMYNPKSYTSYGYYPDLVDLQTPWGLAITKATGRR